MFHAQFPGDFACQAGGARIAFDTKAHRNFFSAYRDRVPIIKSAPGGGWVRGGISGKPDGATSDRQDTASWQRCGMVGAVRCGVRKGIALRTRRNTGFKVSVRVDFINTDIYLYGHNPNGH